MILIRAARAAALTAGLGAVLVTCTPPEVPVLAPAPLSASPEIRIGLAVGSGQVEVMGDSGLTVLDGDGAAVAGAPAMAAWMLHRDGARVAARGTEGWNLSGQASVTLAPRAAGGLIALNGRWYRGRLSVMRDRTGLTVINTVPLEEYLVGVVAAEMGRKDSTDTEALAAQAIVSRTFAIRNLGKRAADGFDLLPTVVDQAYAGVVSEYSLARAAVARTAGMVITWQGVPIDAFFFSTCAGRTANGTEVFAAADRPYLVSIRDLDGDGQPYCRISPRYRWREDWTAGQLESVLRQTLPVETGTPAEQISGLRAVQVVRRSGSDRVMRVTVTLARTAVDIDGPAVRRALHPVGETALRSATFDLLETRDGSRLTGLTAVGAGAGHGVGFCQWGAVGRARAGQDALTILGAYFPGTTVSRAY